MKLFSVAVFVSTLLILHTARALIPGLNLRYLRSTFENANRYQIRGTVPKSNDVNAALPTNFANADAEPQTADRVKPQQQDGIPKGSVRPEEDMLTDASNEAPDDEPIVDAIEPANVASIPQIAQTALPTDADYPKRRADGPVSPAYTGSEFSDDSEQDPSSSLSQVPAFKKLKMYVSLTSVLANIARIPQTVALQIDSVISGLQSTYPSNTNVGAYMMGTRFLLRNPRALQPFDLLDRAGFGRLPDLVSSMPGVFLPMINAMDRVWEAILRRFSLAAQRFAGAVRSVTERASRSLAGVNFARGLDSYSVSVPNLIDLVVKGRLASRLDELFAYLQRLLGSGLSSVGSAFSGSSPVSNSASAMGDSFPASVNPARNQRSAAYRIRSNPRFSATRDYYRPSRYYNN